MNPTVTKSATIAMLVPISICLGLAALPILRVEAPLRVHGLGVICLALAFLVPAVLAARTSSRRRRFALCFGLAAAGILVWDASARLVIVKAEPFRILLEFPTTYLAGGLLLALISYGMAWVIRPPGRLGCSDLPTRL
jgi:hypothetical protein